MSAFEVGRVNVSIYDYDDEEEEKFDDDPSSLRLSEKDNYYFYTIEELLDSVDDWDEICVYLDDRERLLPNAVTGKSSVAK